MFSGNGFNPCQGSPTRFAPISDKNGDCVPSLYAGSTFDCACYETVFHDVPPSAKLKTVPKQNVTTRSHTTLKPGRSLTLANLRAVDLKKWSISRQGLIASSPKLYLQTARWAEHIHRQFPTVDGLCWTSNQCDPDTAYLFFGDRVSEADLVVVTTRDGLHDPSFLADVRSAGLRGGIRITI